jgi:hypothetical protein
MRSCSDAVRCCSPARADRRNARMAKPCGSSMAPIGHTWLGGGPLHSWACLPRAIPSRLNIWVRHDLMNERPLPCQLRPASSRARAAGPRCRPGRMWLSACVSLRRFVGQDRLPKFSPETNVRRLAHVARDFLLGGCDFLRGEVSEVYIGRPVEAR